MMQGIITLASICIIILVLILYISRDQFQVTCEFIKSPLKTGMIVPSSKYLASEISRHTIGTKFLLIGMGTGSILNCLLLNKQAHIDAVDLSKDFVDFCKDTFQTSTNVTFHNQDIVDYESQQQYHSVVSTIPHSLISNDDEFISILQAYKRLTGFRFIHYQYALPFNDKRPQQLEHFMLEHGFAKKQHFVLRNIPPTYVNVYTRQIHNNI